MVKQVAIQIIIVSAMMWLAKGAMYESYYIRTSDFMMEEVNGYACKKVTITLPNMKNEAWIGLRCPRTPLSSLCLFQNDEVTINFEMWLNSDPS